MNCRSVANLPPKARLRELSYAAVWKSLGAISSGYAGGSDKILQFGEKRMLLSESDDNLTTEVSRILQKELLSCNGLSVLSVSPAIVLDMHRRATSILENMGDERNEKHGLLMLKDDTGSGWWRMTLPSRYFSLGKSWWVDLTTATLKYDDILEYDTIFVQRVHSWEECYVLERLKQAGKRIIYDLDDDIFHIPSHNPASRILAKDEQFAAMACMKSADVVTVTTGPLQMMLSSELGNEKVFLIPNALDPEDGWRKVSEIGSPDGKKRIFWSGGATHAKDWEICFEAIKKVMSEKDDVFLVILGFLPPIFSNFLREKPFQGRIEYMSFSEPDTYFSLVKHVAAEVGIAPLHNDTFNKSKSCIKFVEYSLIGMPTLASNVTPYDDAIYDRKSGFLVDDDSSSWYRALSEMLSFNRLNRQTMVEDARKTVDACFNIRKESENWKKVLLGEVD